MVGVETSLVSGAHARLQPASSDRTAALAGLRAQRHHHRCAVGFRALKLPR